MLLETIRHDSLEARKARDQEKSSLLVTLLAEASRPGKDAGNRESTDAEVVAVVRKFLKGIEETLPALKDAVHISRAKLEKQVLEAYLPTQLAGAALRAEIEGIVAPMADKSAKAMGAVMASLKSRHAGAYDGAEASKLVKEVLSK